MLGLNQDTLLGAFRERAERAHSGKRQTINRAFFHLDIAVRKQAIYEAGREHRYAWRSRREVCILSAVPRVTESDAFYDP